MKLISTFLDLFLPKTCVSCKQIKSVSFCKKCIEKIIPHIHKSNKENYSLLSPFEYKNELKELLHYIKFEQYTELLPTLSTLLNIGISELKINPDTIILTVPSHKSRVKERGFDVVSKMLDSSTLKKNTDLPRILTRQKRTTALHGLTETERQSQVKNAFQIQNSEYITGKSVLLIDDIHTSGATIKEISHCLLNNGAKKVNAITLAYVK